LRSDVLIERQNELEDSYSDEQGTENEIDHRCLARPIREPLPLSSDDWLATYSTDQPDGKCGEADEQVDDRHTGSLILTACLVGVG
jgi:hypothetical protein